MCLKTVNSFKKSNLIIELNTCHVSSFNSKTIGISQNPLLDFFNLHCLFNPNHLPSDPEP